MDKVLVIFRGLPGSGKSTLALALCEYVFEADQYFDEYYDGFFTPSRLKDAHQWCKNEAKSAMQLGHTPIAVANTSTQEWEMKDYEEMAERYGYQVHHVIVENRHGSESVHNVPEETIEKMRKRFSVSL